MKIAFDEEELKRIYAHYPQKWEDDVDLKIICKLEYAKSVLREDKNGR